MRLYGGTEPNCGFSVSVSANDVRNFKRGWPCSGLPARPVTFGYDSHGDLVEILPYTYRYDGEDLAALCKDAQRYAARRLRTQTGVWPAWAVWRDMAERDEDV